MEGTGNFCCCCGADLGDAKRCSKCDMCPFCKEDILAGALKCKHCGSALSHSAAGIIPATPPPPPAKRLSGILMPLTPAGIATMAVMGVIGRRGAQARGAQARGTLAAKYCNRCGKHFMHVDDVFCNHCGHRHAS
jgi:ribosomal protein L37E